MGKIAVCDRVLPRTLKSVHDTLVDIPGGKIVHLQFRRFSSCPICNLHIGTFVERHLDLVAQGITEVVVFHSTEDETLAHADGIPFALIADPKKQLYKEFGIESSLRAVLHPKAIKSALKGLAKYAAFPYEKGQGYLGLPADFLIAPNGEVVACHYGKHADDHWSVDDVLYKARHLVVN